MSVSGNLCIVLASPFLHPNLSVLMCEMETMIMADGTIDKILHEDVYQGPNAVSGTQETQKLLFHKVPLENSPSVLTEMKEEGF